MSILERLEAQNGKRARFTITEANMILAKALTAERARVRALVREARTKALDTYYDSSDADILTGYQEACDDILAKLMVRSRAMISRRQFMKMSIGMSYTGISSN